MNEHQCELLGGCLFFNSENRADAVAKLLKQQYCLADSEDCARYRVATQAGREHVPPAMYPNDLEQADQIVAANA